MFFYFSQNNSGGSFHFDEKAGITHHVIVEARDLDAAIDKAESIGLYFDGCDSGRDCPCCGDRWHKPWKEDGTKEPELYGMSIENFLKSDSTYFWMDFEREICVHYENGRKAWHGQTKEQAKERERKNKAAEAEYRKKNAPKRLAALLKEVSSVKEEIAKDKKKSAKKGVKKDGRKIRKKTV